MERLTSEDVDLQNKTTKILENILEVAYNEGSLVTGDDEVGDNTGTDDSEESTD